MLARWVALLGIGISLAVATPAISLAQSKPQVAAETAKDPVVKKKKQVSKAKAKVTKAKAKSKAKKAKPEEVVEEKKPRGLFASLFGGALRPDDKKPMANPKLKKQQAEEESRPIRKPAVPLPGLEPLPPVENISMNPMAGDVVAGGNNGELRSETVAGGGIMASIFGAEDQMLPETRALDNVQRKKDEKKKFRVKSIYEPQEVEFSGYPRGTIVIDTDAHFLYLVESSSTARRYGIAVGKDGLQFKGSVKVGDKQEWPRWIPTKEMQEREPKKYGQYKDGMPGGGANPLGARAIYLYNGRKDTHLRIHGTIAPQSIGTNSSNGCFRMVNDHVMDLYRRVPVGTNVVIL